MDLIDDARAAQPAWEDTPLARRLAILARARGALDPEALAEATGKNPFESLAMEVATLLELARWLEKCAADVLETRSLHGRLVAHKRVSLARRPRGVVLSLAPFNFPLAIGGGDALMALAAGNAVVLKVPEGNEPALTLLRAALVEAGLDERLFALTSGGKELGAALVEAGPDLVLFTGSEDNGRAVAQQCAARLIPTVLELGGNAPALVLDDAELKRCARALVWGALVNGGEVCAAVERVYVVREVMPALRALVDEEMAKLDPEDLRTPPTLFEAAPDDARVVEERFTAELPLVAVADEAEAIERANETGHGLVAYVFTKDRARFNRVARALTFGTVMQDDVVFAYGYPAGPWAARGRSGWGASRGQEGLRAHTVPQLVVGNRTPPLAREAWWFPYTDRRRAWIARGLRAVYGRGLRKLWREKT